MSRPCRRFSSQVSCMSRGSSRRHIIFAHVGGVRFALLSPAEWQVEESQRGDFASFDLNWQLQSHYLIHKGQVVWAEQWSDSQISAGRVRDQQKLQTYLDSLRHKPPGWWNRLLTWLGIRAP
jgi:hypothetical protein